MGKYESSWKHLQKDGRDTFRLSFEEIKEIPGFETDHIFLDVQERNCQVRSSGRQDIPEGKTDHILQVEKREVTT
jgi:hypothetical protein